MQKLNLLLCMAILVAGCDNVTVRPDGGKPVAAAPTYSERQNFFFWGLSPGARQVDLSAACGKREVSQFRARNTFTDGALGLVTLGIYTPRHAQVWCGE